MYKFRSASIHYGGHQNDLLKIGNYNQNQIKVEPMLFSCDLPSARRYAGPFTHEFLDLLEKCDYIDSSKAIIENSEKVYVNNYLLNKDIDYFKGAPGVK